MVVFIFVIIVYELTRTYFLNAGDFHKDLKELLSRIIGANL